MLSITINDGKAKDVLLKQCDFDYISINMKLYINRDVLAIVIAQQKNIEISDARVLYEKQIEEVSSTIDALHLSESFYELYQIVCGEINHIFDIKLKKFQNT